MQTSKAINDILLDYIASEAALIVVMINQSGMIIDANMHAKKLLGGDDVAEIPFADMIIDFAGAFDLEEIADQQHQPHLLNVKCRDALPQTYYFHFQRVEETLLAIGQQDQQEHETMRTALLQLNNDLSNLTRELQKKTAALKKLDAQKNQFFGMAAHDIRHPLSVIRMYSEFLEAEAVDFLEPTHVQFFSFIKESTDLMENILNDFLDISAFETGQLKLERRRIELGNWLVKPVQNCNVSASKKNIEIKLEPPTSPCWVNIDPSKMAQVVYNLLSNATKFSPPGEGIRIGLQRKNNQAVLEVADNGPGISEKDQAHLFTPFIRLRNNAHHTEKSSGLGLAIVKKIVDAHEGKVWVESNPGKGTSFFVSLPLHDEQASFPYPEKDELT